MIDLAAHVAARWGGSLRRDNQLRHWLPFDPPRKMRHSQA
jgi:hypothetical protein